MKFLIQTINSDGKVIFADIVDQRREIAQVIELGDDEKLSFRGGVAIHKDGTTQDLITQISDERSIVLRVKNQLPATY